MKIQAYKVTDNPLPLVPAEKQREWMDQTPDKFAYRCLPLQIANSTGWWLLNSEDILVSWTGGMHQRDLTIHTATGDCEYCTSSFGSGILTIHPGYLFKTEYDWDLYVTGPTNYNIDHMIPLTGIVETFWLPFTFTMNWKLTSPGTHTIRKGTPICQIIPIPHKYVIEAELLSIEDDQELKKTFTTWAINRNKKIDAIDRVFNQGEEEFDGVNRNTPTTHWEKNYYIGREPVSNVKIYDHITKRNFPGFK